MKNRAKCKLCQSIIESFHATDYVECKCGEISVCEGDSLKCGAKDWKNFLRVDNQGNEISVLENHLAFSKIDLESSEKNELPKRKEIIGMLDEVIKSYENLPQHAMKEPINHYDFISVLLLVSSALKAKD